MARLFYPASSTGDVASLQVILAENVVPRTDGGGKVRTVLNPINGMQRVMRMFSGFYRKLAGPAILIQFLWIDGLPGYVSLERDGVPQTTAPGD